MEDKKTISYFDKNIPKYSLGRGDYAISKINKLAEPNDSLLDIGCGTGNILLHIRKLTKLKNLSGFDVSKKYLDKTKQTVKCKTYLGSICDDDLQKIIPERFDFVVIGAVLHHLIGKTRKESRKLASLAIKNALSLLKENGYLIIWEPVFSPLFMMDIVFYIKKILTTITSKRIPIFGYWNNLGAPVVSFLTEKKLIKLIKNTPGCKIIDKNVRKETKLPLILKMAFLRKSDITLIIKKTK